MESEILAALADQPASLGIKALFRHLGLPRRDYTEYRHALHQLLDSGQVTRLGRGRLTVKKEPELVRGMLRLTQHGYGFVDRAKDSIFISAREARKAFDGDEVTVSLVDSGHAEGPSGQIIDIDVENRRPLLAQLRRHRGEWFADVKSGGLHFSARIDHADSKDGLKPGNWALVRFSGTRRRYPLPVCELFELLGDPAGKGTAERGLLLSAGFSITYPRRALEEAEKLRVSADKKGLRRDLRDEYVVTIDPADARDHDDAVSLRRDAAGDFHLGVHIADVSRYVPEGSAIEEEAHRRAFSVYLQQHHLPMLPPRLPGELCSLKPGRDRLALSVLIQFKPDGQTVKRKIVASRVQIKKLLSYKKAQKILDGKGKTDLELAGHLRQMWKLASALKKRRLAEGGLDFDLPEAGFHWEGGAAPRAIYRQPRLQSHQLIEEFMLAANRAVAEVWAEKFGAKAPNLYRVHEPPDAEKRQKLSDYLAEAGFDWPADQLTEARRIAAMLEQARRRFPIEVTSIIARKALMLARYEVKPRGHFGLGFKRYLHFTSPIRRFSDLTVHRLLWDYIISAEHGEKLGSRKESLEALCGHLSEQERRIADLERDAIKLAGLLYLEQNREKTFEAVLIEAHQDKLFVALKDLYIEGMLAEDSQVQFQSRRRTAKKYVRSRSPGRALAVGDRLEVVIDKIDLLNRKLELRPV